MQLPQQEVSSAICGFAATAKLSISSSKARCSLWLSTARLALSPRCGMKATCPLGPSILCGVIGACFFAVPCSPPTSAPWGNCCAGGATVDCTEEQEGEGVRREGAQWTVTLGTGLLRGTATSQHHPLLLFFCSLLLYRVAEKMPGGVDVRSYLQGKCSGDDTVHLV